MRRRHVTTTLDIVAALFMGAELVRFAVEMLPSKRRDAAWDAAMHTSDLRRRGRARQ